MNCAVCKVNKIGPETKPFGGFLCTNDHLQCNECNASTKGYCGSCKGVTKFLQMKFSSPKEPLSPVLRTSHRSEIHTDQITRGFSKQLFDEVDKQSRISEEHLTMKESIECISQATQDIDNRDVAQVGQNSAASATCMKTLFIGTAPTNTHSFCIIDHTIEPDAVKGFMADELPKDENNASLLNPSRGCKDVEKENTFPNKEDPSEYNIVHTSEIRFMESTSDLECSIPISKFPQEAAASRANSERPKFLSAKVLRDFDSHHSANSEEVVHNYLETYSPTALHGAPAYNCEYLKCHFTTQPTKPTMKTVSVSTESHPSLNSSCYKAPEKSGATKLNAQDYIIMHATNMISDKSDHKPSMDVRMQKILETFKEDVRVTKFAEKPHLIKIPTQSKAPEQEKEQIEKKSFKKEDKSLELVGRLSNTHRAYYNAPLVAPVSNLHFLPQPQPVQQEPPPAQFQTVPCTHALAQELLLKQTKFSKISPVPASWLNIPRSPIKCPESTCQRTIFVSDFCKHLMVDHKHLPMERITPFQCKNFFLDARLFHCGSNKSHLLYLMCDKICDLGSSEYKDFLPVLIMTSSISLNQICDLGNQIAGLEYYLIWATSIAPEELPISVTLAVWSRSGRVPSCHVVYSGQMYSIRNSQSAIDVYRSGRMLLLSSQEINALTNNGKDMLNIQLSVH